MAVRGRGTACAVSPGSCATSAHGAVHCVAHQNILVALGPLESVGRVTRADLAKRHRGAGAHFGVLALAEKSFPVEQPVEEGDAGTSSKGAVCLEERHFLREIGAAQ